MTFNTTIAGIACFLCATAMVLASIIAKVEASMFAIIIPVATGLIATGVGFIKAEDAKSKEQKGGD